MSDPSLTTQTRSLLFSYSRELENGASYLGQDHLLNFIIPFGNSTSGN